MICLVIIEVKVGILLGKGYLVRLNILEVSVLG